ncbi:MAG TPA: trehalase family glycosidase [Candidatus Paceibacterota bacterium]|nr:trehalase family glycosidase [Candidatus Paceibacterota bacterium]
MELPEAALTLLRANRRTTPAGHTYTVPSPSTYPYQWLWDSCFHAIVLAKLEPEAAISELRSLLSRQMPDGMVPHMIFWQPKLTHPYHLLWQEKTGVSGMTQPPMVAYAALEIYRQTKETAFLKELFPSMLAYYRYLIDKRDPHDHHLISIINPDESGEDNSPRFDVALRVKSSISFFGHMYRRHRLVAANRTCAFDPLVCMHERFWVKDVPFNAILIKNLECLAEIAALLEEHEAKEFATTHKELISFTMREFLMAEGVFWSAVGLEHGHLKVATWAHFAPLFAGLYTPEEAKELIRVHFNDPETFRSAFGIRTVSKKEPSYRSAGFWRGPVWFAPHWFIHKGLMDYGFFEEARWLRETSTGLVEKHGFREYFDPESGKAYGAHNFTWGTLVLDMLEP